MMLLILAGRVESQSPRKTVAVLDFQASAGISTGEASTLTNRFRAILVQTKAFEVVEREKMNEILKEQDFTLTDQCNTSECAVQVGQLLGVEAMIAGDIGKIGKTFTIDIRLIDVTSAKILQSRTEDYQGEIDGLLGVMRQIGGSFAGVKDVELVPQIKSNVGDIYITSNPEAADIYLDGEKTEWKTPYLAEGLAAGVHKVEARLGDLVAEEIVDLAEGGIENLYLKLAPINVPVKLTSEPTGALLYVDGEKRGQTPVVINLPVGKHIVKIEKNGFESFSKELVVSKEDGSTKLEAVLKKLFRLTVTSPQSKSKVFVDDILVGRTPLEQELAAGKHIVRVEAENEKFAPFSRAVNLEKDATIEAVFQLRQGSAEKAEGPANRKLWYILGGAAAVGGGVAILVLSGGGGGKSNGIGLPDLPPDGN